MGPNKETTALDEARDVLRSAMKVAGKIGVMADSMAASAATPARQTAAGVMMAVSSIMLVLCDEVGQVIDRHDPDFRDVEEGPGPQL